MNAPHRLFVKSRTALWAATALAGLGLVGCAAGNPLATAPIDPRSPVAPEVARLSHAKQDFPAFTDIPPMPADQRPLKAWGQAAGSIETAGVNLDRATAPGTWTLTGTDTFVAAGLRDAGGAEATVESTTPATEAFAREQRKRATPPPPPKR